jgi:methionyl-tRNA formyltransferase
MYVIHPSLLPKYRGAAPIYHTLLNNDTLAGVSFLEISKKKFDSGSMLLQQEIQVNENWDHQDLALELGKLGKFIYNIQDFIYSQLAIM